MVPRENCPAPKAPIFFFILCVHTRYTQNFAQKSYLGYKKAAGPKSDVALTLILTLTRALRLTLTLVLTLTLGLTLTVGLALIKTEYWDRAGGGGNISYGW